MEGDEWLGRKVGKEKLMAEIRGGEGISGGR